MQCWVSIGKLSYDLLTATCRVIMKRPTGFNGMLEPTRALFNQPMNVLFCVLDS